MTIADMQHHAEGIVALLGALWTLLSVINGALTSPEAKSAWHKLVDGVSYIARKDAMGSVKAPFTLSKAGTVDVQSVTVEATVTMPSAEAEEVKS